MIDGSFYWDDTDKVRVVLEIEINVKRATHLSTFSAVPASLLSINFAHALRRIHLMHSHRLR